MKRLLPFIVVGVMIVAISVVLAAVAVYYMMQPGGITGQWNKFNSPFTLDELQDMEDKPEKAAGQIPRIVSCFETDDEEIRVQAAETLRNMGPKAVEPLREMLKSKNAKARYWSALTLALIGPDAAPAAPDLVDRLKDGDVDVRQKSAYALGKTDVKTAAVFSGLIGALADPEETVKTQAAETLRDFGAPPKESLPTLVKLAGKDAPAATRLTALKLLGQMGKAAVPAFQELLKTSDTLDTIAIIGSVSGMSADARPLLPELQAIMIKSRHWDAEAEMLGIFKKCGADGASGLTNVLKILHDPKSPSFAPDDERSTSLLKAIGALGADAKVAVPLLIELLGERERLRPHILQCLGDIGPAAKEAIPAVEALVNAKTPPNDPARIALRRMGKIGKN